MVNNRSKVTDRRVVCEAAIRDPAAKRSRAFVDAAAAVFLADGFGAATMSSIASRVGGSKSTLWAYFPSKDALFAAVVDDFIEQYGEAHHVTLTAHGDVHVVLEEFARSLMRTLTRTPMLQLYRLVVAEASRFPQLAELFYDRGPRRGEERLAEFLHAAMERGEIRRGDPLAAAQQFVALCRSGGYQRALLELSEGSSEADIEADIMLALDTFKRAWAGAD